MRSVLAAQGPLREYAAPTVFSAYGLLFGLSVFLLAVVFSLLRLKPLPLQCALYANGGRISREMVPPKGGFVVVDSVRQVLLIEALRRYDASLPIIVDMDDLMSRRVRLLLENGYDVSLGAFAEKMPKAFSRVLSSGRLARLLMRYEAYALTAAEARLCAAADTVVTVSQLEAAILRNTSAQGARARVMAIAPLAEPPASGVNPFTPDQTAGPVRFVFVGSDRLVQNRSSIDQLKYLWETHRPNAELVIFGSQGRTYPELPPRMRMHGFVASLADVYDGRSVLICPTVMAGGVKTKVFEAFVHAAPVVGNKLTYEGIETHPAFLTFDSPGLEMLLLDPESVRAQLSAAAISGQQDVVRLYGPEAFSRNWATVISSLDRA